MNKTAPKIALVAQTCIAFVFVLTHFLYAVNVVSPTVAGGNVTVNVLVAAFALLYALLSAYLLWTVFGKGDGAGKVLLHCDDESSTLADVKVIRKVIRGCQAKVKGLKVTRICITETDKRGYCLKLYVKVPPLHAISAVDEMRCLLRQSFLQTLQVEFRSVDFVVDKFGGKFTPNTDSSLDDKQALQANREQARQCFNSPLEDNSTPPNGGDSSTHNADGNVAQALADGDSLQYPVDTADGDFGASSDSPMPPSDAANAYSDANGDSVVSSDSHPDENSTPAANFGIGENLSSSGNSTASPLPDLPNQSPSDGFVGNLPPYFPAADQPTHTPPSQE